MVTTDAPSGVTNVSATLNGTVTLNDATDGTYRFKWGTSSGSYPNTTPGGPVPGGSSDFPIDETISSLSPGTTYYYEACATNSDGEICDGGADEQSFTTPDKPTATLGSPSAITNAGATLSGMVDPNGDSTTYAFHYGTSSQATCGAYPGTSSGGSAGSGSSSTPVSDSISGLAPNTKYFFRLSASNTYGNACSGEGSFTTQDAPTPTTGSASSVGAETATLNGTVNPNGASLTSAVFKYCTGCANASGAGSSIAATLSGSNPVNATANLSGLASGATFHYILCATNTWGTNCGADKTFTTDTPPTAVLTTADPTTGPTPLTVNFDGSGSSDPDAGDSVVSYTFTFGDGASKTQSTPTIAHTYTNPCSPCTASLTVTDKEGATSSQATLVIHATANQAPVAILSSTPTPATGTVPFAVTFDGSQSNDPDNIPLKSWSLDFGDGNSTNGTGAVPNAIPHTYSASGTYHAKLTVTDSSNVSTPSTPLTVTVNPPPSISVANVSLPEGNSGATNFAFVVKLSAISTDDVKVDYATADGTATAGSDYTSESGTLTIPANTDCTTSPATKSACQIQVPVIGDTTYESDETFSLNLTNPMGATLPTLPTTVTGTILNDDLPPWLEFGKGATLEGDTGSVVSGAQSWSAGGSLQLKDATGFPFSQGAHAFFVSTPGSPSISGPFTYHALSGNTLSNITPAGSVAAGQIAFQPHHIAIPVYLCDPVNSPDKDPSDCVPVTSGLETDVNYTTSNGQSLTTGIPVIEGQDYVYATGTLKIPAGQSSGSVTFDTIPNTTRENPTIPGDDLTRWFNVNLSNAVNGTIASKLGIATIIEDDGLNPPLVTTGPASSIGTDHATIAATVNPNGYATTVYVQYGPTDSYGTQTAPQSLPAGRTDQPLTFSLTGLSPGTLYHYQVVATHSVADGGAAGYGQDMTFTTDVAPKAVLKATPTSGVVKLDVTLNGSGSSDSDGSIVSWKLDFGDGKSTSGTGSVPSSIPHTYESPCSCTASLTVTDNQGAQSAPAKVKITVTTAPPPSPGKKPMGVSLTLKVVRATPKGIVRLPVRCKGNVLASCKGQTQLALGTQVVGLKRFSVPRGHRKLVPVRLKKGTLRRLLASSGGLHLTVNFSVRTGVDGFVLTTKRIRLLPPRA